MFLNIMRLNPNQRLTAEQVCVGGGLCVCVCGDMIGDVPFVHFEYSWCVMLVNSLTCNSFHLLTGVVTRLRDGWVRSDTACGAAHDEECAECGCERFQ
jgi:hypothetical protein